MLVPVQTALRCRAGSQLPPAHTLQIHESTAPAALDSMLRKLLVPAMPTPFPSSPQAITFSSAQRFQIVGNYFNVTQVCDGSMPAPLCSQPPLLTAPHRGCLQATVNST